MKPLIYALLVLIAANAAAQKGVEDQYGQNASGDWPQKVHSDADLIKADAAEEAELAKLPMKKVGFPEGKFFTIKKLEGKWWFVTPRGTRFWSTGLDCVGVDGGKYKENLIRKWGEKDYQDRAQQRAFRRMQYWNFASLGNWADEKYTATHRLPYVHTGPKTWDVKVPFIEGDICDAFDPRFPSEAIKAAAPLSKNRDDNFLIGYFVDNELPWWNIGYDVLGADDSLVAKKVWLQRLQKKYGNIAGLNAAWGTKAAAFTKLQWPGDGKSKAADAELAAFRGEFAERFYDGWYKAIKHADPNHLVLGSRIPYPMDEVVAACARHTDVLSFNHYSFEVGKDLPRYYAKLGKPILIGEYAFDSLDEGLLGAHIKVKSQAERGAGYSYLTERFAAEPYIVGAHYFQYIDEPLNGRSGDGENSFNGFVRVTDIAYPPLVRAAQITNQRVEAIHAGTIKPTTVRPLQ